MRRVSGVVTDLQQRYISNQSSARGQLAKLRRAISNAPGTDPDVWNVVARCLPQEMVGRYDEGITPGEWAAHIAVALFAVHQQSLEKPMHQVSDAKEAVFHGLGHAVNELAYINKKNQQGEELEPGEMPRRFSALVTAESIDEVAHYARQIVQQLRSVEVPLDYGRLAGQLYVFQYSYLRDRVRLEWAREFAQWRPQQDEKDEG
jgi:CRISPR system Cascade subunit CasB